MRRSITLFLFALFVFGCGSDAEFNEVSGQPVPQSPFIGSHVGANNVAAQQAAVLNFNVNTNGMATGTLLVNPVTPQAVNIAVGTYNVTGTVDLATGVFNLSGNIPNLGTFSIVGTLSVGGVGSYTFTINNQTFQGAVQPAGQGTPQVPTGNNNNNNNNNNGGGGQIISGGSLQNFTFTTANGYNGADPPVTTNDIISGAAGNGQNGESTVTILITRILAVGPPTQTRAFTLTIVDTSGDPIEAGDVFQLASGNPPSGAVISLSESQGTTATVGWAPTNGTTGQIEVISRDQNSITLEFTFTGVGPNSEIANNPAVGTFTTSGRITGNFQAIP